MKYEVVREIFNMCDLNKMRDIFIEEKEVEILTLMSRSTVKARMRALRMYPRRTAPVFTI